MPSDGSDILYRCNFTWFLFGQNVMNSFFFRSKPTSPLPTIPAELSDLHDDIRNHLVSSLRAIMSSDIQLLATVLFNLNGSNFYQDVRTYDGIYGQIGHPSLPSVMAQVLSWHTAFRGRRLHGRSYIAGVPINAQQANTLTPDGQTLLDNAGSNIVGFFGDGGSCRSAWFTIYSRKNGNGTTSTLPPATTYNSEAAVPVTRYVADNVLFTQRHRLQGRGI